MEEPKTLEDINPLDIYNYAVTFYGGKLTQNTVRANISLHDINGKISGVINFYDDISQIEKDSVKYDVINMNLSMSDYQAILLTLRSNRRVCFALYKERAILVEFAEPKFLPSLQNIPKNKVN